MRPLVEEPPQRSVLLDKTCGRSIPMNRATCGYKRTSAAIIGCMRASVVVVYPGTPTMVDAVVAGVSLRAEWVGMPPSAGGFVDVELGIDAVLGWADTIAMDGAEATLRRAPTYAEPSNCGSRNS